MKIKIYMCGGESPISEYPIGIGYLMAYCKNVEYVKDKNDLKDCDLIGLSSVSNGVKEAIEILNNTDIPVCIGGQATLWEKLKEFNFKYIVKGEGEIPLTQIINGEEPEEKQIENIDDLPYPILGRCNKTIPILSSRGCLFNCNFCSSTKFWKKIRFHSSKYFIEQIKYLNKQYPDIKDLYILDDLFTCNFNRLVEIHQMWMKNNFNKRFIPRCLVRASVLNEKIFSMLKDMGFISLRFGAESGSNKILKLLNKQCSIEKYQEIIDLGIKYGFTLGASFMYDIPGETEEDKKLTQLFIKRNKYKLQIMGWYKFQPFPGTKFYNNENLLEKEMTVR